MRTAGFCLFVLAALVTAIAGAEEKPRLLLIGQGPDGHPKETHEYYAGLRVLEKSLAPLHERIEIEQVRADGDWLEGPELLASADAVVLFVSEGATWIQADGRRYEAFAKLAERGGGFVALHWAIGTRDAKNVAGFQKLVGGCHGGDDRKYKVLKTSVTVVEPQHPVTRGIGDFTIKDEFYYKLKFVDDEKNITPLLKAKIADDEHTVCWAWQRGDGGRSVGFSALHYHENWRREEYRRLAAQAVLWTLKFEPPQSAWPGEVNEADYRQR